MKDIEQLIKLILKLKKEKDAYYHYGVEYSSDQLKPWFKAYIGWSKEGLQPLNFMEQSKAKLIKALKAYLDNKPQHTTVQADYHRGMIVANQTAIKFHEELIRELENPSAKV